MKQLKHLLFFSACLFAASANADVLCVKSSQTAKKNKVSFAGLFSVVAGTTCPKGGLLIIDTSIFTGPIGATGAVGATGAAGATGVTGATGAVGATGAAGATGATGADGALGVYGDGSAGSLTVSTTSSFTQGNAQFTNVTINSGVTLTISSGAVIRCTGSFTNNGTIVIAYGSDGGLINRATSTNLASFVQPGVGVSNSLPAFGEISTGGTAVFGGAGPKGLSSGFEPYFLQPGFWGGGGGAGSLGGVGGRGSGFFAVYAKGAISQSATGTINGDAEAGTLGAGGGGGSIIILASKTSVTNAGTILARGGAGAASTTSSGAGGGGGGGLVHVLAPSISVGTTSLTGGAAGSNAVAVSSANRGGGGAGGASSGSGGDGADVSGSTSSANTAGTAGDLLQSLVDPTNRLL